MDKLKAINPEHQSMVNRCISWLIKYDAANTQLDLAEDISECEYLEDDKEYRRLGRRCANTFDKYLEYADELPKREVANIEASDFY